MTPEIFWLTLTALMTGLLSLPYILNRIAVRGLIGALGYETATSTPHSPWAARAIKAHANAVENLVVFAAVVLAATAAGVSTPLTATATMVYFFARLAHYVIYAAGLPVLRTLAFMVGLICQIVIALEVLGWI